MTIRPTRVDEREALLDIWLRSVRATHHFLTEADIQFFLPHVREAFAADALEVWTLCDETDAPLGFMMLTPGRLEALFLDPAHRGAGWGRLMLEHALSRGVVAVDVNEQNEAARAFYERCGFVVEGRSELDGTGRPFPLLHMKRGTEEG